MYLVQGMGLYVFQATKWGAEAIKRSYAISMLLVSFWQWLQMMHIEIQNPKVISCSETVAEHNSAWLRYGRVCLLPLEHWDSGSKIVALIAIYTLILLTFPTLHLSSLTSFPSVLFIVLPQLSISFSCKLIVASHRILWIKSKLSPPCFTHHPVYF